MTIVIQTNVMPHSVQASETAMKPLEDAIIELSSSWRRLIQYTEKGGGGGN